MRDTMEWRKKTFIPALFPQVLLPLPLRLLQCWEPGLLIAPGLLPSLLPGLRERSNVQSLETAASSCMQHCERALVDLGPTAFFVWVKTFSGAMLLDCMSRDLDLLEWRLHLDVSSPAVLACTNLDASPCAG